MYNLPPIVDWMLYITHVRTNYVTRINIHGHVWLHEYALAYVHMYINVCSTHVSTHYIALVHESYAVAYQWSCCVYACEHTWYVWFSVQPLSLRNHAHINTSIHMHAYLNAHMRTQFRKHMRTHPNTHTHTHTHTCARAHEQKKRAGTRAWQWRGFMGA